MKPWEHPVRALLAAGQPVLGLTITTPNVEAAAMVRARARH